MGSLSGLLWLWPLGGSEGPSGVGEGDLGAQREGTGRAPACLIVTSLLFMKPSKPEEGQDRNKWRRRDSDRDSRGGIYAFCQCQALCFWALSQAISQCHPLRTLLVSFYTQKIFRHRGNQRIPNKESKGWLRNQEDTEGRTTLGGQGTMTCWSMVILLVRTLTEVSK